MSDIPDDLIRLRREFDDLGRRCEEIDAALPSGVEIVDGAAVDWGPLDAARAQRAKTLLEIYTHPWVTDQPNPNAALAQVRDAARTAPA
ncbi:hypothetical protein [Spirillospora sp. CA-294931]|uniref:hypothetical protein n=1 Tax=Spirillospora sp. CA-294931 TaxID=3240042 RepID=UPI003D8D9062